MRREGARPARPSRFSRTEAKPRATSGRGWRGPPEGQLGPKACGLRECGAGSGLLRAPFRAADGATSAIHPKAKLRRHDRLHQKRHHGRCSSCIARSNFRSARARLRSTRRSLIPSAAAMSGLLSRWPALRTSTWRSNDDKAAAARSTRSACATVEKDRSCRSITDSDAAPCRGKARPRIPARP